ncbi:MAG: type II toxin-antitoxin system VapC family toxin [Terracidiphilus sp.]
MGEGLVQPLIAYLDTHIVLWLAAGKVNRLSSSARSLIERSELLFSAMAYLELEYLHELGRTRLTAPDLFKKVEHEINLRFCDLPSTTVAAAALDEKWTRDPFDRLIVANAKANGFAWLISADESIRQHYPRAVW